MSEELKLCPFCKGKAKKGVCYNFDGWVAKVWCTKCYAEVTHIGGVRQQTLQGAIDKWNRRAE